jgi:hypothetical protein
MESFKSNAQKYADYFEFLDNGGGNLIVMYGNEDSCKRASRLFSRWLFEHSYSLNVVSAFVPVGESFANDIGALYNKSKILKQTIPMKAPANVLPFTRIDRNISAPIVEKTRISGADRELSAESNFKNDMYKKLIRDNEIGDGEDKFLDNLVTEKWEESLLAVIYIDGNGIGDKLRTLKNETADLDYDAAIEKYREFSNKIYKVFVGAPKEAIDRFIKNAEAEAGHALCRWVVSAGDEITLICNARVALEIVLRYFKSVMKYNEGKADSERFSSCAGIAVFHAHAPFARIYKVAEECCENCKSFNRRTGNNSFWFDFQFVLGGIANTLDKMRENEDAAYTNRPYCYGSALHGSDEHGESNEHGYGNHFLELAKRIIDAKMTRGEVKNLTKYLFDGESYFEIEIERQIVKHGNAGLGRLATDKKSFYDISLCYDIWLDTIKNEINDEGDNGKCQI